MKFALPLTFAALLFAGCKPSAETPAGSSAGGKKITVCMLPKKKGVPYFTSCSQGAEEAAKQLGNVELIYDGPTDGAPEKAAAMIEKWALQGVDVIAVSPNDPDVLAPAMKKAREKGVHVVTWDADGAAGTREYFVNQATAQDIGYALVDTMAKDIGGEAEGEVAIITATLTAANQNEWMKFMKERLAKYPKLSLVGVQPCNEDQKVAFQVAQDLIKAHPNLRGMWAISSVAFPGAAEAVKQSGTAGKVFVTGLSTPNDMRSYVKDGTVKSVLLWNTKDLGYLTVYASNALANGGLKAGAASLSAGRLGEKKIAGDQVLLGDILVFTKDNIDQFDF
ncbi:MAG: rhamnose transport system substrate-binding protein [Chthoniobacter sp.]|jgi:ABC-type sugar transport system substrate-binding protein|nr:rhamnose transport system substrate-binding protein [Chthoniobacter sp.]